MDGSPGVPRVSCHHPGSIGLYLMHHMLASGENAMEQL